MTNQYTLQQLADATDTTIQGDPNCIITSVATLKNAAKGQISFLANEKYLPLLQHCEASAVIVPPLTSVPHCDLLISDNPYFTFAKVASLFDETEDAPCGVHPSAIIGEQCEIHASARIGPNVVIERGTIVQRDVVIGANSFIGHHSIISEQSYIMPNVTIYHHTRIGKRNRISSGAVIGADGFGFAEHRGQWHKIPQLGKVIIGDDVDIGANTTIDRGTIENTVIQEGVKIDNLVQIAHNVVIGAYTVIAGCVGIAGSATIGRQCAIGGAACVGGHIEICDNVKLTGMSMATKSITKPGIYSSGTGISENAAWRKNVARFRNLDKLVRRVSALEKNQCHLLEQINEQEM